MAGRTGGKIMAEFQEVMGQWKRMCDTYTTEDAATCCKGCRMAGRGCGAIYEDDNADFDVIEREVMAWAKENPEPVYPSWGEWLTQIGVMGRTFTEMENPYFAMAKSVAPIPAHIAQKLGIKPKEGT
jgi:hypothetical protein